MLPVTRGFCSLQPRDSFRLCALLFFLLVDLRFSTVPRRVFYTSDAVRDKLLEFLVSADLFSEEEAKVVRTSFSSWLVANRKKGKGVEVDVGQHIWDEFVLLRQDIQGYFGSDVPLAALITLSGSKVCIGPRNRAKEQKESREFNFAPFYKYFYEVHGGKVSLPSKSFLEWLIGFAEGDGCFVLNKTSYLSFVVTQGVANRGVLDYIQRNLGMGVVGKPHVDGGCDYYINRTDHIRAIVLLFNGNIVLPTRVLRFRHFLDKYNALPAETRNGLQIPFVEGTLLPSLQDDWLLGFTEAEGVFYLHCTPGGV
jgi:LAGLIDADG endonuclease